MARGNLKQGFFKPTNPSKYVGKADGIVFRSSWELRFCRWCDANPAVLQWTSEEIVIPYFSAVDQRQHRYFVDFFIKVQKADGTVVKYLVEIKPKEQTLPPKNPRSKFYQEQVKTYVTNQEKWKAATAWANQHDSKFIILTEYELGLVKKKPNGN